MEDKHELFEYAKNNFHVHYNFRVLSLNEVLQLEIKLRNFLPCEQLFYVEYFEAIST